MMTKTEMLERIDLVADHVRRSFVGDPVRAFEYKEAEKAATEYKAAGYTGSVPAAVASWSQASGLTATQAADDILAEAEQYSMALNAIRSIRLNGKAAVAAADDDADAVYSSVIAQLKSIAVT